MVSSEKKNILIVSRSFYPENSPRSFRTTELVKEFARQGHEVTLLTLKKPEHHVPFEKEYGVTIRDMGPLRFPQIRTEAGHAVVNFLVTILQRGLGLFFEYPDIELVYRVKKALKRENSYDLLISIAVPHPVHWGVAFARKEHHPIAEVWAADCGDPYMGFNMDRIGRPFYFKYLEKMFCRKADFITVPIEGAKKAYYEEFRYKIKVIPQGFQFDKIEQNRRFSGNGIPRFAYAGSLLGGGRNPHRLLRYLTQLDKDYKFIVYTKNCSPIEPYLKDAEGRIEVRDYIPRSELLNELKKMHFLINLENGTQSQSPSKLIDYYLTGRPVLSIPSDEFYEEQVNSFLNGDFSAQVQFGEMDRYRIEHVTRRFLDLCQ